MGKNFWDAAWYNDINQSIFISGNLYFHIMIVIFNSDLNTDSNIISFAKKYQQFFCFHASNIL